MERGTLYQLRNLLDRRNVTNTPKKDVNSSADFLEMVIVGYVLVAVMSYLGMSNYNDVPLMPTVSPCEWCDLWMEDDSVRLAVLNDISSHIVDQHIDSFSDVSTKPAGTMYEYTCEVLSLGLLYLNFKDAVREGDGDRVILSWKYLMLIFRATRT